MKRTVLLLLPFLAGMILLSGCDGVTGKSPSKVAEEFLNAMSYSNFDEAKELATEDSHSAIDFVASMDGLSKLGGGKEHKEYEIIKEEINGDYAKVYYKEVGEDEEEIMKLRKDEEEKTWKVMFSKNDMGEDKDGKNSGHSSNLDSDSEERGGDGTPSEVAKSFLTALSFGDKEKAKRLASKDSESAVDMTLSLSSKSDIKDFEVTKEEIEGEYAKVWYLEEGEKEKKMLKLSKNDSGRWEVIFSKNDLESDDD